MNEPVYGVKKTPVPGVFELGVIPPAWNQNWTPHDGRRFRGPGSHGDLRILSLLCWLGWQWQGRHWRASQRDDSSQHWHVDGDKAVLMMVACDDPTQGTEFCTRPRGGKLSGMAESDGSIAPTVFKSEPFHVYLVDGRVLHRAPSGRSKKPRYLIRYVLSGVLQELLEEQKSDACGHWKEYLETNLLRSLQRPFSDQLAFSF